MDGSDEDLCDFICYNMEKIPMKKNCDGVPDCSEGEDENNCQVGEGCEGAFQFACWDGQCLDINQQCDGVTDCSGGEDEQECPESSVYDIGEEIVSYDAQDFEDESEDEEEEDSGLFGFW